MNPSNYYTSPPVRSATEYLNYKVVLAYYRETHNTPPRFALASYSFTLAKWFNENGDHEIPACWWELPDIPEDLQQETQQRIEKNTKNIHRTLPKK